MAAVEHSSEGVPSTGTTAPDLSTVATVGLDLAKHVFQVHAVDGAGHIVTNRALRRKDVLAFFGPLPCCLIGLEAYGSAHHWARELMKFGHEVRLMPPAYVKAYVRARRTTPLMQRPSARR